MGCGQSKILIYHRKSKGEKNDKHGNAKDDSDASDSHADAEATGSFEGGPDQAEPEHDSKDPDSPTNLLESSDISASQIDFFKMLDEKIESGPDYEEDDLDREQERLRLRRLLQDWLRRSQLDTQRFPTAYQPCPPTRPPRVCPRLPMYPPARAYLFSRAASVETAELQYHDSYSESHREDPYAYANVGYPPPPEQYAMPSEPPYGYSRMLAGPPTYGPSMEGPDMYTRSRALLAKTTARAMSFDVNPYSRGPMSEVQDSYGGSNEFLPRGREMHYPQHVQHPAAYPHLVQYTQHPQHNQYVADPGQEHIQYIARPPPREMPPLQGAPGPPGPPHGSPRPLAVRLPTSAAWRRPRGPVTELV